MKILETLLPRKPLPGRLGDEEGFLDIDIPLISVESGGAGKVRYVARGEVLGQDIGFAVVLHAGWDAQPTDDNSAIFYWGSGVYQRTGPESDRFVELVERQYGIQPSGRGMLTQVPAEVVGLDSDPAHAVQGGAKMKFFFHGQSEDAERYAEVFTNINVEEGMLEFREKDNEYRLPLVRALAEV